MIFFKDFKNNRSCGNAWTFKSSKVTSPRLQSRKFVIAKSQKGWCQCSKVVNHSTRTIVVCVGPKEPYGGISGIRAREQLCALKQKSNEQNEGKRWGEQRVLSVHEKQKIQQA